MARPGARSRAILVPAAFALVCAALLAAWCAFDRFAAGAAPWWFTSGALGLFALPLWLAVRSVGRPWAERAGFGALVLAVVVALLPWHPRKRFVAALFRVQPGMTVEQADAMLRNYALGAGPKWTAADGAQPGGLSADGRDGTLIYRWNDRDGAWDSDQGVVTIRDGRVASVEFLPD